MLDRIEQSRRDEERLAGAAVMIDPISWISVGVDAISDPASRTVRPANIAFHPTPAIETKFRWIIRKLESAENLSNRPRQASAPASGFAGFRRVPTSVQDGPLTPSAPGDTMKACHAHDLQGLHLRRRPRHPRSHPRLPEPAR